MSKTTKLKIFLQNPLAVLMNGVRIREQAYYKKKIISKYNIQQIPTIDLLDLFPDFNEEINSYSFLGGTSLITDMLLLKLLAKQYDNGAYLEIGSWRGESIVNVADVMPDCTSLTLSPDEMRSFNYSEDFVKVHGIFSHHVKSIKIIEHNSRTFDFSKLNKEFDLIFIDGDHTYEGVLNDTQKTFSLRKNEKSVIVWHDYGFDTENVRHNTLLGILDGIPKEKHGNLYHVSNTMCAIYIEGLNLPTTYTKFPSYPNKKFSLKVSASRI
jgi:hypothetical protein